MEIITCKSYKSLCEHMWDQNGLTELPESGIVYCPLDVIADFFRLCDLPEYQAREYIIVSASSDFGVTEQSRNPVSLDLQKWLRFIPLDDIGYNPLLVPSRHKVGKCKIEDRFSVKMYSWTGATFNRIPDQIKKWFVVNADIDEERIIKLPFGVQEQAKPEDFDGVHVKLPYIYVNFADNTLERVYLKQFFSRFDWAIVQEEQIPYESYLATLKSLKFILVAEGNGLDSYRLTESLLCGATPVVEKRRWNNQFEDLPIIFVDDFRQITSIEFLLEQEKQMQARHTSLAKIDLDYWKNLIGR